MTSNLVEVHIVLRRRAARQLVGAVAVVALGLAATPALADPSPAPPTPPTRATPPAPAAPFPLTSPPPAGPVVDMSPLAVAQREAAALQQQVEALRVRTEQAIEHYNEVQVAYAQATERHRQGLRALRAALALAQASNNAATDRIRALYMTGGAGALAAAVVDGHNVSDVLSRFSGAQSVVQDDTARVVQATVAAEAAQNAEVALAEAEAQQRKLRHEAAVAAAEVKAQLAATQRLLDSASAAVQALLAAQLKAERDAANKLAALLRGEQLRNGGKAVAFGTAPDKLPPKIAAMLLDAEAQVGKPYLWGAVGPDAYDCSGFTQHAYAAAGVLLPRTSRQQWYAGTHPDLRELLPGDLLFWASNTLDPATIHHVAIYIGGGSMLASPHTGAFVRVQRVYSTGFLGATRVIPSTPTEVRAPAQ